MSAIILFMKMVISIGFKLCSMKTTKKGIYCIEGLWDHTNIKDKSTVLPILNLLENRGYCNFIHHSCATREELVFFLNKWKQKSVSIKYPILYLAFHGQEEGIFLNSKDCYTNPRTTPKHCLTYRANQEHWRTFRRRRGFDFLRRD